LGFFGGRRAPHAVERGGSTSPKRTRRKKKKLVEASDKVGSMASYHRGGVSERGGYEEDHSQKKAKGGKKKKFLTEGRYLEIFTGERWTKGGRNLECFKKRVPFPVNGLKVSL